MTISEFRLKLLALYRWTETEQMQTLRFTMQACSIYKTAIKKLTDYGQKWTFLKYDTWLIPGRTKYDKFEEIITLAGS